VIFDQKDKIVMKIISLNESNIWLGDRGIEISNESLAAFGYDKVASYVIPIDSGKKTFISKVITSFFSEDAEALFLINEFGIWPTAENWGLFNGFRKSIGEICPLPEKPGHIFSRQEIDTIFSLLSMTLYFYWGAIMFSPAKNLLIKVSHDEIIEVFTNKKIYVEKELNELNEILKEHKRPN